MSSLHQQWVRCGRSNCRCARGQLHGPYLASFERVEGRQRKTYIRMAEGPTALARQRLDRAIAALRKQAAQARLDEWRRLKADLRDLEQQLA